MLDFAPKTCVVCGKDWTPQTKSQNKYRSTCGKICYQALQRKQRLAAPKKPLPKCLVCGDEFRSTGPTNVYCSKDCRKMRGILQ